MGAACNERRMNSRASRTTGKGDSAGSPFLKLVVGLVRELEPFFPSSE